jgi:hypothetical protein
MPTRKCGRQQSDPAKLRSALPMEHFLIAANIPPLPAAINWGSKVARPMGPMLNNQLGDCVIAAQGHAIQCATANASQEFTPPDSDVLAGYMAVTGAEGAAFDPQTGANDNGCQLSDGIDYMIRTGMSGHKYLAKLALNAQNFRSIQYGIYLFGFVFLGVDLTPATLKSIDTWDIPASIPYWRRHLMHENTPDPNLGHAVPAWGYGADGSLEIASWGGDFRATPRWQQACIKEVWVAVPVDWANTAGMAPNMFDMKTLESYLPGIANA